MKYKLFITLLCLTLAACRFTTSTSVRLSEIKSHTNVQGSLVIEAPTEVRSRIASLLVMTGSTQVINMSSTAIETKYTIYKSGVENNLDAYSWGLYYGKNNTLILFFRRDFLEALKGAIGTVDTYNQVKVRFMFYNDTLHPVQIKVRSSWLDGEPISVEVATRTLEPNGVSEVTMSQLSLHFVLKTGVESVATIIF